MNDLWLSLGCLLFLFVLWVYSGGPNNPISYAGPYITPVTGPGVAQTGYGGGSANQFFRSADTRSSPNALIDSARSPYSGDVVIGYSNPVSSDERSEYILIHLEGGASVDVTGWQLVGAADGVQVRVPAGSRGASNYLRDVILTPDYRSAYVFTGARTTDAVRSLANDQWRTYLGRQDDIWRNGSDTITLLDQNGKIVDQYRY